MNSLFIKCLPAVEADSVFSVDYEMLKKRGVRAILFDIDNTIVPFTVNDCSAEHIVLFQRLHAMGFQCCFLSNNRSPARVNRFAAALGASAVARAKKPSKEGFLKALTILGVKAGETAVIGDQLFTDVLCANRNGALSILVKPVLPGVDEWQVGIKRVFETLLVNILKGKSNDTRTRH